MAEIAVNIVIDKLIPLLAEEAKLLKGIHKEVESIKRELEIIAAFLKEADAREARGDSNDLVRAWVKQVIDVAYRIEDVIDEYLCHVAQQKPQRLNNRKRFVSFLNKIGRFIAKLKWRHELANEVQEIKEHVRDIKNIGNGYGLISTSSQGTSSSASDMHNHPPIASLFVDEAELVGVEGPRNVLLSWFEEEQAQRMVFSLVGMGGVGKSTIAKKVFDNKKARFDCYAWLTVSQTYSMKELLRSLIRQFHQACKELVPSGLDGMDEVMLIDNIHDYVKEKRYVVAFDDIWNVEFWMAMKHALPDHKNCSRIIITTRNENVAPSSIASSLNRVHQLQPLPFENSWELFCKKVFQSLDSEAQCPPELHNLSQAMVRRCEGLPLAIVAIGGILSAKRKDVFEWQKFHDSLVTKLESNENLESVTKVLSLSYHDLPYYLKPCLLYFGMFPEDCSIKGSRFIRQWIAEGFVKPKGKEIIEDVAEDYLMELVRRNLIQVSKVDYSGRAREYRVHDLIRDFILSQSEEQRFGTIFTNKLGGQGRRLSISNNARDVFDKRSIISPVRSIFLLKGLEFSNDFIITLVEKFKLLNILDFENANLTSIPDEVGDLFHLKYLSIRNSKVERLPESLGKLQQLETLDMKKSLVRELPIGIKKLCKLRHLLVNDGAPDSPSRKGVKIMEGLGCERSLQKLEYVEADGIIKDLGKFRELRNLSIVKVTNVDGKDLCCAIGNMEQLRSLEIIATNEHEVLDLHSIASPPPLLQRVFLGGRLEILPDWISKLHNVTRMMLWWTGLAIDPLEALQDLPNLLDLTISYDAYIGEQLHFRKAGFEKLKVLSLFDLKALKTITIDEGALSNLEMLEIGPSPLLMEVPSGIQHLRNLNEVCFFDMPEEFYKCLVADQLAEGPNYKLIRDIPEVYKALTTSSGRYCYHSLK